MKKYKKLYQSSLINYNMLLNGINSNTSQNIDLSFFLIQKMKLEKLGKFKYNIEIENFEQLLLEIGVCQVIKINNKFVAINETIKKDNILIYNDIKYYDYEVYGKMENNFVLCYDNSLRISKMQTCMPLISLMQKSHDDLQKNINFNSTKFLVSVEDTKKNIYEQSIKEFENNKPLVFLPTPKFNENVQITQNSNSLSVSQFLDTFYFYNELKLSFLGIKSDKNDKKERLTVDEENDRNATIDNITQDELNARYNAFKLILECFNVEVICYEN